MTRRPCIGKIVLLVAFIAILLPHMAPDVTAGQLSGSLLGEYKALKEAGSIAGAGKIRSSLRAVMNKMEERGITRQNARERGASTLSNPLVRVSDDGSIHAYIHVHTFGVEEEALLEQYGAVIEITNEKLGIIQAWVPADRIYEVAQLPFVRQVTPPSYGTLRTGSVTSEGDAILNADQLRAQGFDGTGAKVGVISDGVTSLADAQASGDLPATVNIVTNPGSGDEGTAMLEIVHDLAPGAELSFCGGFTSSLAMIACVNDLGAAGMDVIVDDLGFFGEPFFEDGDVAEAVMALPASVVYVSAAGNDAESHYEANLSGSFEFGFVDGVGNPFPEHNFGIAAGGGSDPTMDVLVAPGETITVILQWNDPFGGSGNDYDLLLMDEAQTAIIALGADVQDGNDDPIEGMAYTNVTAAVERVKIVVTQYSGQDRLLEFFVLGFTLVEEYNVPGGSIFGHPAVDGILATAAINADDPGNDTIASYSSHGPAEIYFPTRETRQTPDVTAIDRVLVTGAGGFPSPFGGTSAAAPHVAAVAAQLKGVYTTASEIINALKNSAVDLGTSGFDNIFGAGRIDALAAAQQVVVPEGLYYPHVDTNPPWATEIAIINTGSVAVSGTLHAFGNDGQLVESIPVDLTAPGRREIDVAVEFSNPSAIGYVIFETTSTDVCGYTKFYVDGTYRVAVPAVQEVNSGDVYVSHIASEAQWWTGVSILNTTGAAKTLTFQFNDGQSADVTLAAGEHKAFTIASLFGGAQPTIGSAVITNASGIVGLELFGSIGANQLSGILLKDDTTSSIYYPHVDSSAQWWTGIVAFNPGATATDITITPYSAAGVQLSGQQLNIPAGGKYIGVVSGLGLPAETAWLEITSASPITGFELFGTLDGNQLAGYTGVGISRTAGVFAKVEDDGWTGIAFVNIEDSAASVTLNAHMDDGTVVATEAITVPANAKVVDLAENLFTGDISAATSISYSSDRQVVGFQLNGSTDGMMLDGLPALPSTAIGGTGPTPTDILAYADAMVVGAWSVYGSTCTPDPRILASYFLCPAGGLKGVEIALIGGSQYDYLAEGSYTVSATPSPDEEYASLVLDYTTSINIGGVLDTGPGVLGEEPGYMLYDPGLDNIVYFYNGCWFLMQRLDDGTPADVDDSYCGSAGGGSGEECGTDADCGRCWYCDKSGSSNTCRYGGDIYDPGTGQWLGCYRGWEPPQ